MNCANCGAALQPVGNRNYFRCPYCETFFFPEETEDGVAIVGGNETLECPICAKQLAHAAIEGNDISYCTVCRGFLTTNAIFSLLVQLKRARNGPSPAVPIPFAPEELRRHISCPRCHKPMDTHPYYGGGNAVIDTCPRCQVVWLDAGELTVLGQYQSRSGTIRVPQDRDPEPEPKTISEPRPEPLILSLFGFPIRLS
jgi:Zn-finger nucleic acid-binding protein